MILGYHLLQIIRFTHELVPVTSLFLLCVLLVFGVLVCVVSVCLLVMTCDSKQDYVSVLHQFTFEATLPQTAYA